jgi:hypothetical protein
VPIFDLPGSGSTTEPIETIPVLWIRIGSPDIGAHHHCLPHGNRKGIFHIQNQHICSSNVSSIGSVFFRKKITSVRKTDETHVPEVVFLNEWALFSEIKTVFETGLYINIEAF